MNSIFKSSSPESLSAKIRSSSQKCSPLNNYIKLHLPPHPQNGFYIVKLLISMRLLVDWRRGCARTLDNRGGFHFLCA